MKSLLVVFLVALVCNSSSYLIDDVKCTEREVLKANHLHIHRLTSDLANTTYFRLFRVQLDGECPLDGKNSESSSLVDKTLSKKEDDIVMKSEVGCDDDESLPSFWANLCAKLPFKDAQKEYINLQLNPEQYTGYNGSNVWSAIYNENCFDNPDEEQCYEEKFLYRILSGLHSSINLHISENFYPPRKGVRDQWEPNLERFQSHFSTQENRFKNLEFAFVVLLRSIRKATPVLKRFQYETGNRNEDIRTQKLVKMLLDSYVLSSCQDVFEAFDETLLFEDQKKGVQSTMANLKRRFKGIFYNISETFNCIKCQKCRLHGKLQLLGIGTALKILLLPDDLIQQNLSREEVVALINTIAKFSEAIEIYHQLSAKVFHLVGENKLEEDQMVVVDKQILQDSAFKAIVSAIKDKTINQNEEDQLVDATLNLDEEIMFLAKHFAMERLPESFIRHAKRRLSNNQQQQQQNVDAIIIGGGLSGLTAAVTILDRGGSVILIEKEGVLGGNSAKASSGINGIDQNSENIHGDSVEQYRLDTLKGSLSSENKLVDVLTTGSVDALEFLRNRIGMKLQDVGQLGGHSKPRTWRPSTGLAGSEIIAAINKVAKSLLNDPNKNFQIMKKTKVENILTKNNNIEGVECLNLKTNEKFIVKGNAVIIATGGFAYHQQEHPLLEKFRPDLQKFATTNGKFATGDGIQMAMDIGADLVDIKDIQVHPTAFIDPKDKKNPVKTLAAELLRGIGAILLDKQGKRFVNELGTRKYVSETMLNNQKNQNQPEFLMILNEDAAKNAPKHIPLYLAKGLMQKYDTIEELAKNTNMDSQIIKKQFQLYDQSAKDPIKFPDPHNRTVFPIDNLSTKGPYYVGLVTPALHYCMGGLRIDQNARVLNKDGNPLVKGAMYAIGEATGGIHGRNRLGGNALTECVVFGRHVGKILPLSSSSSSSLKKENILNQQQNTNNEKQNTIITKKQLEQHNKENDLWVAINGKVYDFTEFAPDHPAGAEAIVNLAGKDGTIEFKNVHSDIMLEDFEPIGEYKNDNDDQEEEDDEEEDCGCDLVTEPSPFL